MHNFGLSNNLLTLIILATTTTSRRTNTTHVNTQLQGKPHEDFLKVPKTNTKTFESSTLMALVKGKSHIRIDADFLSWRKEKRKKIQEQARRQIYRPRLCEKPC
ncbi:hypothetical protein V1525DRAFT_401231 [Lipomyces kononenkoae]|uniref:Uncharacterized protein n=1 Tax=Lipomyces kononenkoae TaxID=34357 RepID=A0ACC3T4G5_LIPKO